jgi:hypothetical protein
MLGDLGTSSTIFEIRKTTTKARTTERHKVKPTKSKRVWGTAILSLAVLMSFETPAAGFPSQFTVEPGFDRPGADYENFEQTGSFQSPGLCRDACDSQPQCRSFTYVKPGIAGPKARCWLKNTVPPPVESLCCISGVKGGRPPQSAVRKTRLAWQGWDVDKVGHETTDGQPDGQFDQHFRLFLTLESPQVPYLWDRWGGNLGA